MTYETKTFYLSEYRAVFAEIKGMFISVSDTPYEVRLADYADSTVEKVVVNLNGVTLLTSHGIRNLILLKDRVEQAGLTFYLLCDNTSINRNLQDLHLNQLFNVIRRTRELQG